MAADTQLFLGCIAVLLLLPALLSPWSILLLVLRPLALLSGGLLTLFIIAFLVSSRRKRRPPRALPRQLAFTTPAAWASARVRHQWAQARSTAHEPLHQSMSPDLTASVDVLFALVISTFVSRWFDELTGPAAHQGFPDAIERLVRTSLAKVIARCETVDWVDLLVGTLVPRLTNHLNRFREAEVKLRGSNKHAGPAAALAGSDELDLLLATGYARQKGGLHAAVDVASFSSRPSEEAHLRRLVDRILPLVLPEWEVQSQAVRTMAREIVACTVVLPLIQKLADPDWWNKLIEEKAGAAVREQKMVSQLREALDAAPSRSNSTRRAKGSNAISVETGTKEFDRFLRSIKRCATIGDARRLRSDVDVNMRRSQLALSSLADSTDPTQRRRAAELTVYVERLALAQQKIDKRLRELGSESGPSQRSVTAEMPSHINLHDVLQQPAALPLFMEYMDRCHRLAFVEFYLTVEGLKDPLADLEGSQDLMDARQMATLRDDIQMLWSTYFAAGELRLSERHIDILRSFCTEPSSSDARAAVKAKRSMHLLQREAFEVMDDIDFPAFTRNDLFLKASAAIVPHSSKAASVPAPPPAAQRPLLKPAPSSPTDHAGLHRPSLPQRTQSYPTPRAHHSPPLSSAAFAPMLAVAAMSRTDTAPPQVTFRPAFEAITSMSSSTDAATTDDPLSFLMASPKLEIGRKPLFDDADEEPEEAEGEKELDFVQVQTIEAIQDALNSILETDAKGLARGSNSAKSTASLNNLSASPKPVGGGRRVVSASPKGTAARTRTQQLATRPRPASPSSSRPNAVGMPLPRRPLFDDDVDIAAPDDASAHSSDIDSEIETAARPPLPIVSMIGDLELQKELDKYEARTETLRGQEDVLEALVRKAELTGNARELKLLAKSRAALHRELRGIDYQRAQLEAQAAEHRLVPGRVAITISGTTIGEAHGKSFVLYLVEVHQLEEEGGQPVSGWFVTRRYSEFDQLDRALRDKLPHFRAPELPSKHLVTALSGSMVELRRAGLERYLKAVVKIPAACASGELRTFLSQANITLPRPTDTGPNRLTSLLPGQSLVRTLYRSITTGIDDIFSGSSMMDAVIQRLSQQAAGGGPVREEDLASSGLLASVTGSPMPTPLPNEGITGFTAPLCDFFVELFGLEASSNWLRRQAILIVLQQVLGGTIERKLRDSVKAMLTPSTFVLYISALKDAMFPNSSVQPAEPPPPPRTAEQKAATRDAAARSLSALMPAMAANIIGRHNARRAARNIFAILQSARLNRHIYYTIIDDVLDVVFPELKQ